jgi:hypothetical protein
MRYLRSRVSRNATKLVGVLLSIQGCYRYEMRRLPGMCTAV